MTARTRDGAGVATVVTKLLSIVRPDLAFFGEKDYQQLAIVTRMVRDLDIGCEIVPVPTVREPDGLALSSRNGYLSPAERGEAIQLSLALKSMAGALRAGSTDFAAIETSAMETLARRGWKSDYMVVRRRADLLAPVGTGSAPQSPAEPLVVLGAAKLGNTRLIDNLEL